MTLRLADRVQETVAAPSGSAAFAISSSGAWPGGFQAFVNITGVTAGDTVNYTATGASGNAEVCVGTYASGALTRTTMLTSSNSNAACLFSGTVTVFLTQPAARVWAAGAPLAWPGRFQTGRYYCPQ